MKCHVTKIQSNIAIWQYIAIHANTIYNMALTRIVSPLANIIPCMYSVIIQYLTVLNTKYLANGSNNES